MSRKPPPIQWQTHQLVEGAAVPTCATCGRTWKKGPTGSENCPGLRVYAWGAVPEGLFTIRQLDEKRLKAGEPRGLLPYSKTADGYLRLYLESEATPKKPLTEAQQATVAKMHEANEAAMRCPDCGAYKPRKRWFCEDCRRKHRHENDVDEVREHAIELLARDFVLFDTETTGLGYAARIVSIAIINPAGETILDTKINPGEPIPADATAIHGITDEMAKDAPTFADVYPAIFAALNGKPWVAYNISFDTGKLHYECQRAGLPMPKEAKPPGGDVMHLYAVWYGEWSNYFQDYKRQRLPGGSHGALGDAVATLELLKEMAAPEVEESAS